MPAPKTTSKSPHDIPGSPPRKDEERGMQQAIIEDADKSDGRDRDLEHGEGGTLGLPSKPGDISQDD
jgi:hypothetical protein